MKAKKVYENIGDVLKPKSEKDIIKSLKNKSLKELFHSLHNAKSKEIRLLIKEIILNKIPKNKFSEYNIMYSKGLSGQGFKKEHLIKQWISDENLDKFKEFEDTDYLPISIFYLMESSDNFLIKFLKWISNSTHDFEGNLDYMYKFFTYKRNIEKIAFALSQYADKITGPMDLTSKEDVYQAILNGLVLNNEEDLFYEYLEKWDSFPKFINKDKKYLFKLPPSILTKPELPQWYEEYEKNIENESKKSI